MSKPIKITDEAREAGNAIVNHIGANHGNAYAEIKVQLTINAAVKKKTKKLKKLSNVLISDLQNCQEEHEKLTQRLTQWREVADEFVKRLQAHDSCYHLEYGTRAADHIALTAYNTLLASETKD